MGQAFDQLGNVLGSAEGDTKAEVFEKLMQAHPEADSVEIHTKRPPSESPENLEAVVRAMNIAHQIVTAHNNGQKRRLKGQLHDLIDSL